MPEQDKSGSGVYIVCAVACAALVALLIFVYANRNKGTSVPGCRMVEMPGVPLPDDILTSDHHRIAAEDPLTVVVHHSKNCGFCKRFRPVAEEAARATGVRVVFSEVDASSDNRSAFQMLDGVNGVPCYTKSEGQLLGIGYRDVEAMKELLQEEVANKI